MAHHSTTDAHAHNSVHVVPIATFTKILVCLLLLTIITVAVAQVDFGGANLVVALLIATLKATLVIIFFMHGLYENKIIWTYILVPFILLTIMIGGTFTDDPFRARPEPVKAEAQ